MNQHKEDSIFYTPGEGDKNSGRLSISAAVDVVRASFLSSDQSTGKDYFYHYKFLLHHRLHHRNGHLGLFYVSHTPSGDALSLRVPYRLGKEFTSLLIGHLAKHNKENSNLSVHHIASLCSAILFYKLENEVSLNFLVSSVRVLLEDDRYILLRGYEVCQVLLAYAMLNFKGDLSHLPQYKANTTNNNRGSSSNFYVLLGQRAGALADYLTEKDILSVLSVIDMVSAFDGVHKGETSEKDNDHKSNVFSNLRKTLESSIRIRSLHRKVQYDTV
ncbi:hypothetical protein ADEAN_000017700 [Angomonas deanei]|uniref:Uncharacterized protein n=1 Tax=Angomonas deanei TaxID=59799 RepID=A0A7G2BZR9_9TRYP|nr:hypothetical protein ADEAN_000017700 [Angomonas deanei]